MSIQKLTSVFRNVFEDEDLTLTPEMSARDVANWDSFNHINLVIEIEGTFAVTFTTDEISTMRNIGDLVIILNAKGCDIKW
jgi:acyl carrier protein